MATKPKPRPAARKPRPREQELRASRAALDILLTDANRSARQRFVPGAEAVKLTAKLVTRPGRVARRTGRLGADLARVAAGNAGIEPPRGDRRFTDPAWTESWLFGRVMQGYLAAGRTLDGLIEDAGLDLQEERRVRFAAENVFDALAPTNFPLTNPAALKAVIETGGANFVRGARNFARDMSSPPRLPASVDPSQFKVGEDIAATPGAVVLRTEQFELIQYAPQTKAVRSVPLLSVPPMVNRYYLVDLAPGRSLIEYLVERGQQVFAMSWRNPEGPARLGPRELRRVGARGARGGLRDHRLATAPIWPATAAAARWCRASPRTSPTAGAASGGGDHARRLRDRLRARRHRRARS